MVVGDVDAHAAEDAVSTRVMRVVSWVDQQVPAVVGGVMRRCRAGVICTSG